MAPALTAEKSPTLAEDDKSRQTETTAAVEKPDPVVALVEDVEKEYQSGQNNLKAGNTDAARHNFDRAFDLLVASPLEQQSDPRMQSERERILSAQKNLEAQEQQEQQAENPPQQKSEPAPIDEANEAAPPVDASVKAKAADEIKVTHSDLPLMMTDSVAGYINYFQGRGHRILENALIRSGRYDQMIRTILKQEGVPQDLIYLAQAESGFHPTALSRVGARGMWQFMASRGRAYGLQKDLWVDDRQDPEKATHAAARHLKDLYNQFGDWYLAMAAYNSGPGNVQQAVKRTGYVDFWELYKREVLPKETRNYVPIILAMTIMAKNPAQYGLDDLQKDNPVAYDSVKLDYPVDLRLVAGCVDATPAEIQDLNPSLLRWTTPARSKESPFELHLPAGKKDAYMAAISAVPVDKRVWWRYHTVLPGDTLASIARSYRSNAPAIADINELDTSATLLADTKLIIPIAPGKHASSEDALTFSRRMTVYHVRGGDTVQTVADNFNVPPAMVRHWNHLSGPSVHGRRVLYIHLPVAPGTASSIIQTSVSKSSAHKSLQAKKPIVRHKVAPGETLSSIASTHHTTIQALKRDNNVATLRPGMIILIRPAQ
jgi:membrane-bound lytic murein transglycosylase D